MQAARNHLQVCLKLLGILHRSGDKATAVSKGDQLYLATVMLNASLLKALHVADSFQMHCHREFPRAVANAEEEDEAEAIFEVELLGEDFHPWTQEADRGEAERRDGMVSCQTYRRLQAECVVLSEASRGLEQERETDEVRLRQAEEECRKLRSALARRQPGMLAEASRLPASMRSAEVMELQGFGVKAESLAGGGSFIAESELQRLKLEVESLRTEVKEARAAAEDAVPLATSARRRAAEAAEQRAQLLRLLQMPAEASDKASQADAEALKASVRRLVAAAIAPVPALTSARSALSSDQGEPGTLCQSSDGDEPQQRSPVRLCWAQGAEDLDSSRSVERTFSRSPFAAADGSPRCDPQGDNAFRGGRQPLSRNGSQEALPGQMRKPYVVSSAVPQYQVSAERRAYGAAVLEEAQVTKAALRAAKHPGDAQALGKLVSLLGASGPGGASPPGPPGGAVSSGHPGGAASSSGARSLLRPSASTGGLPSMPPSLGDLSPQSYSLQQQRPMSPFAAPALRFERLSPQQAQGPGVQFESPGVRARPVSAVPLWATARTTWPTPEQRQILLANSPGSPGAGVCGALSPLMSHARR
ncbi:unnamed protein product [Polarella glacialis]|uniref:Uncharacterized protein n=1 Tax=Polarella glacialis TaxID=89957 RepID=A0A813GKZ7_POLGL|nr:unnamed protein product [Polarella glacialis]